jgi:energy-coupling factor transporter ATP-binding protein EcfA2
LKRIVLTNFKRFSKIDVDSIKINELNLITGVNNSGKTTVLHALAVWEYTKILLINFRGRKALSEKYSEEKKGLGITPENFTPINIPSLKYLWHNQKTNGSYAMKIKVFWDDKSGYERFLEIAFTLNGNNFAIKKSSSNLVKSDSIPTVAYLPPFGGMTQSEPLLSTADRKKLIGKGQAGAVIRNLLLDLHDVHEATLEKAREEMYPGRQRLSAEQKAKLEEIPNNWGQSKIKFITY